MNTIEQAVDSIRAFEEARAVEHYSESTPTVLMRVPLIEYSGIHGLRFNVKAGVQDNGDGKGWVASGKWEASLIDRNCTYEGNSPEEAIACMLLGACELGFKRYMDPSSPSAPDA